MRKLRLLSMAVVLALTLAAPALAGITDTPPAPPSESVTATGIIECPPSAQATSDATDPVIEFALTVLQSVLLVF
ncbi:MAG: hypothetical protein ACXWID_09340 [Pyrinomonadaceae bacterium]